MRAELHVADGFLAEHNMSPEQVADAVEKAMLKMAHPETSATIGMTGKLVLLDESPEPVGYVESNDVIHVAADTTGHIYPSAAASTFVDAAAKAIRAKLVVGKPSFGLMPYRLNSGQLLGFDWHDDEGNAISFTFYVAHTSELPAHVDPNGDDIAVRDLTDALLLCRLIAERVNGDACGII
jgi:hypothetical protein